jgi:hypothetical protein
MIVDSIDIIKQHVATIAEDMNFAIFEKYVQAAESWTKTHLLGKELYNFIETNKAVQEYSDLVEKTQRIIALNGFARSIPFMDLMQTNAGFAVANTEKVAPASKERVAALRSGTQKEYEDAVEDLLLFLELQVMEETPPSYISDWTASPVYTILTDTFLPTYDLFKLYAPYSEVVANIYPNCRFDFVRLKGKMRLVVAKKFRNVLGGELTDMLLEYLRDKDLPEKYFKLVELLRFALASYTLGLDEQGDEFMNDIISIMKENPGEFPDWTGNYADGTRKESPIVGML